MDCLTEGDDDLPEVLTEGCELLLCLTDGAGVAVRGAVAPDLVFISLLR